MKKRSLLPLLVQYWCLQNSSTVSANIWLQLEPEPKLWPKLEPEPKINNFGSATQTFCMCLTVFPLFMSKSELLALLFSKRVTVNELLPSLFKKGSICYFSRANRSFTHKKQAICSKNQRANFQPWLQRKWLFSSTEEMTFLFFQGNGFSKLLNAFPQSLLLAFPQFLGKRLFPRLRKWLFCPPKEMPFPPSLEMAFPSS